MQNQIKKGEKDRANQLLKAPLLYWSIEMAALGPEDLPPQLSNERLQELVQKVRSGNASQQDFEELANGHLRLARYIAGKYTAKAPHLHDIFVAEALYGLAIALSRASDKLYDANITPYIISYMKKYARIALSEDKTVPIPYSTIQSRKKKGLITDLPKITTDESKIVGRSGFNLYDLKDLIDSCIKESFEREVIELRKLSLKDTEIAEILQCSRTRVLIARSEVYRRFRKKVSE